MLAQASSLGCSESDVTCLCAKDNFKNGIHDCISQACSSSDQAFDSAHPFCPGMFVGVDSTNNTTNNITAATTTGPLTVPSDTPACPVCLAHFVNVP